MGGTLQPSTPRRASWLWAALLLATPAAASTVDVSLTGVTQVRPTIQNAEERSFAPFVAQLGLKVREPQLWVFDDVRAELSAWGRLSLVDTTSAGDLDLAYISAKALDKRLTLTLGRQFRTGGAARALQLDGLTAEARLPVNLGLTAYGGAPVISRFALAKGDATWGGRLFWRPSWETEIGASYFELMNVGYTARRDVGIDFRTQFFRRLSVSGLGVMSLLEMRLAELDLNARFAASSKVEIIGNFRQTSPDLFLSRTSIFSTFADISRTEGGLGVGYTPTQQWNTMLDGRLLSISEGLGYDVRGSIGWQPTRNASAQLQVVRLGLPSNAYTRGRLAGRYTFGQVMLVGDIDAALFDAPINGRTTTLQGQVTARVALGSNFELLLSGLAATDPLFAQRFEVLGRVVYTFRHHTETSR